MTEPRSVLPPPEVLHAFAADAAPRPLAGGTGRSWLAGQVVLKPLDMSETTLQWQAAVLPGLAAHEEFRVAAPLRTAGGKLVSGGWTAWPYLAGRHETGRWTEVIAAGRGFHRAAREVERPPFLADRDDPWAYGDRVAWGDSPIEPFLHLPSVAALAPVLHAVDDTSQLIHGDLTGNVLFHPELPPAVIDISPYWRPAAFADAVVVTDAMTFHGAGTSLLQDAAVGVDDFAQYVVRALIYRMVTDAVTRTDTSWEVAYRPTIAAALAAARA